MKALFIVHAFKQSLLSFFLLAIVVCSTCMAQEVCLQDESGQPATNARIEFLSHYGSPSLDLGQDHCFNVSEALSTESTLPRSAGIEISPYPTVGRGTYKLDVLTDRAVDAEVLVHDLLGRRILGASVWISRGSSHLDVSLGNASPGVYFISLVSESGMYTKQVFNVEAGSGMASIGHPVEQGFQQRPDQSRAGKSSRNNGVRITRRGSRQTQLTLSGSDETITLLTAHKLNADIRLVNDHYVDVTTSYPGQIVMTDLRSNLTTEFSSEEDLYALSDSIRLVYSHSDILSGFQSIRLNDSGMIGRSLTASFNDIIPGPLYLHPELYTNDQSHIYLFVTPVAYDYQRYLDTMLHFLIPVHPRERMAHISWDYSDTSIYPMNADNQTVVNYVFDAFEDGDFEARISDLLEEEGPILFEKSLFNPTFRQISSGEENEYSLLVKQSADLEETNYWMWIAGNRGRVSEPGIFLPVEFSQNGFLNTLAVIQWAGMDLAEDHTAIDPSTGSFNSFAKEMVAVNHAFGPLRGGSTYEYDPDTLTMRGVYFSIDN